MSFTDSQKIAIENKGNTLVMAGAGAGKTRTLVERCIRTIRQSRSAGSLRRMLVVTFTEAAAAEARDRIRQELEKLQKDEPQNGICAQELAALDSAHIKTIHGFCYSLVREHFYMLDLDPAVSVLDAHQASIIASDVLDDLLRNRFSSSDEESEKLRKMAWERFRGWSTPLREAVLELHRFTQTRPRPKEWYAKQIAIFEEERCPGWGKLHSEFIAQWAADWAGYFRQLGHPNLEYCAGILENLGSENRRDSFRILSERNLGKYWDGKKKVFGSRVQSLFDQLEFLQGLEPEDGKPDPMQEDWENCREFGLSLLKLGNEFADSFTAAKKAAGGVDFHDLEQLALRLLATGQNEPTSLALELRERFDQIFVDEYQDINQAQDLIIKSLSKPASIGNTFLVGDVKQSIYSFREADPGLFQGYGKNTLEWKCVSLQDNFRSSEGILNFVNGFFRWLSGKASGVEYDSGAELIFGNAGTRKELAMRPGQIDVELHLIKSEESEERETEETGETPELSGTEQEARLVANRLRELKDSGSEIFCQKEKRNRPVEWSDMVVLLRAISAKAEVYSKAFNEAGIPLHIKRSSFFETREALDLCSLLQILDNPLQDIPLVAVLRSPLVGLNANELGWVRASSREKSFWRALLQFHKSQVNAPGWGKVDRFLKQFYSWRDSKSVASLGQRLEIILADTQYMDWVAFQPRGKERVSNVQHLLGIARSFDEVRNESLYLFLRHIELLQEVAGDIEPPPSATGDCVRLMTIHQSKGLEFPIVAVPDLGKPMNFSDSQKSILLHDRYGLCLKAQVNLSTYPTLPQWLAARESKAKTIAEEMRVLYVALTRAENRLLLFGTAQKNSFDKWQELGIEKPYSQEILRTKSMLDWVGSFLTYKGADWANTSESGETTNVFTMQAGGLPGIKIYTEVEFQQQQFGTEEILFDADLIAQLRAELPFSYAHQSATEEAAKTTVTALRRKEETPDEESKIFLRQGKTDGRDRGLAYHKLFQEIELEGPLDEAGSKQQAERLRKAGVMTDAELKHIDFVAFARFWQSPIGLEILEKRAFVKREVPFTANLDSSALSRLNMNHSLSIPKDDFVVVQGMADLIVLLKKEIWLLDFKTDQIKNGNIDELATTYKPQLNLYAYALSSIYDRPVTRKILYFVSNGTFSEWQ